MVLIIKCHLLALRLNWTDNVTKSMWSYIQYIAVSLEKYGNNQTGSKEYRMFRGNSPPLRIGGSGGQVCLARGVKNISFSDW